MPALAQTKPWWVSQISVAPRRRTIRRLSERISSHRAGALPGLIGQRERLGPGHHVGQRDDPPLRLAHHLVGDDQDVAGHDALAPCPRRRASRPGRRRATTSGSADSGQILRACSRRPAARPTSRRAQASRVAHWPSAGHQCDQVGRGVDVERQAPPPAASSATARAGCAWAVWRARESGPRRGRRASGGLRSIALVPVPSAEGTSTTERCGRCGARGSRRCPRAGPGEGRRSAPAPPRHPRRRPRRGPARPPRSSPAADRGRAPPAPRPGAPASPLRPDRRSPPSPPQGPPHRRTPPARR